MSSNSPWAEPRLVNGKPNMSRSNLRFRDYEHLAGNIGIMSAGKALAIGGMGELRRQSGLKMRQEIRDRFVDNCRGNH